MPARAAAAAAGAAAYPPAKLEIGGAAIAVRFKPGPIDVSRGALLGWVSVAARAVSAYYARFPVRSCQIVIVPIRGARGLLGGTTYGYNGAFTIMRVGEFTTPAELESDWMMTHEMVHMAFPDVAPAHHWIEEGIATYVEPIAREEIGQLSAATVWGELVTGLPKGLPAPGDRGLDYTHTWGRTYWGGALYCTLADVRVRRATHGRLGLQDALKGIVAAGGNITVKWPLELALDAGDEAVGVPVLRELYDQMKATPVNVDLNALWKRLGVDRSGGAIVFNNRAPLAGVRRAITPEPRTANKRRKIDYGKSENSM